MNGLLAALRFLTVLPLPGDSGSRAEDLPASLPFFPVVGLILGAGAAVLAFYGSVLVPPAPLSVLIVGYLAFMSRGLHLDGLADTADGLMGSHQRQRMLEIMRDSRVGAMGVIAVFCVLAVKGASLASCERHALWRAALILPVAGRSAVVMAMGLLPYARPEGAGTAFYQDRPCAAAIFAVLLALATGWLVAESAGLVAVEAALVVTMLLCWFAYRRIGGATGDVLGAVCEIAEATAALAACAWWFSV